MPAPVVQFATMDHGGRIAFHVLGTGPGIAMLYPYHVNHIALNWHVPLHRAATNFLGRHPASSALINTVAVSLACGTGHTTLT